MEQTKNYDIGSCYGSFIFKRYKLALIPHPLLPPKNYYNNAIVLRYKFPAFCILVHTFALTVYYFLPDSYSEQASEE